MESVPPHKQTLVTSFLEIAVGQTRETAVQFLQATNWKLEEAIQLFYVGNDGARLPDTSSAPVAVESSRLAEEVVAKENVPQDAGKDDVRPPLPVKREVLYDDAALYSLNPSSVVAFRNFEEETKHPGVWEGGSNNASVASSSRDNLASLYRPPLELMFQGSFDKAKVEASLQDKWLLVNLQSTKEFSSHMLNRDTWSNEAVTQTIRMNFIFWQVYHDTSEGKKVSTYYNLVSVPAVLVIDPITGQKMHAWRGMVHPERLLEDLLLYMDRGPKEHHGALPNKRPRESMETQSQVHTSHVLEEGEEVRLAIAASLECHKDPPAATTDNAEPEIVEEAVKSSNEKWPSYPPLPDEPKSNKGLTCRVGIRLPDGRRLQRNFLCVDPIQLLWSFCSCQLEEAKTRPFRFTQAIPGATKCLEYDNNMTFEEAGILNSMITFTWE